MLTDDDDVIRMLDIPERMQLIGSTLSSSVTPAVDSSFSSDDLDDAAHWVTLRLSDRHEKDYFRPDGAFHQLLPQLIAAVRHAIEFLLIEHYEVPYIYVHKRDYISHFDAQNPGIRAEFLDRDDLWRIYSLSQKYQAFTQRLKSLQAVYTRLQVSDQYFEDKLRPELNDVEAIADTTEWLGMKYKSKKKDNFDLEFYDDVESEARKRKLPSRISGYEVIKKTIVSKLATVRLDSARQVNETYPIYAGLWFKTARSCTQCTQYWEEHKRLLPRRPRPSSSGPCRSLW